MKNCKNFARLFCLFLLSHFWVSDLLASEIFQDKMVFKAKEETLYFINGAYPNKHPSTDLLWNLNDATEVRIYKGWNSNLLRPGTLLFVSKDLSGSFKVFPECPNSYQDEQIDDYYLEVLQGYSTPYYYKVEVTSIYIINPN